MAATGPVSLALPSYLLLRGRVHERLAGLPGNLPRRSITDNLHAGYASSSDDSIVWDLGEAGR